MFRKLDPVSEAPIKIDENTLAIALDALRDHQSLGNLTRTVHVAAWANMAGQITIAREDVGRHNALDKLLGALAVGQTDMVMGFVVISSRCSYEMVEKAIVRGVKALLSISAPTGLAIQKAKQSNLAIYTQDQDKIARIV